MSLHQHREDLSKIFRSLAAQNSNLPDVYDLILGCNDCFSDGKFQTLSNHRCTGILIFCRDCNSKWLPVRPSTRLYSQPCQELRGVGRCAAGDSCPFAHNRMEEELWKANIDLAQFQRKVQNQFNLAPTTNQLQSGPNSSHFNHGNTSNQSNTGVTPLFGNSQNFPMAGQSNATSGKSRRNRNKRENAPRFQPYNAHNPHTMSSPPLPAEEIKKSYRQKICEAVCQQRVSASVKDRYVIDIGCNKCYVRGSRVEGIQSHVCGAYLLLAKEKGPSPKWSVVRQVVNERHNQEFMMCLDLKNRRNCPRKVHCTFAHNIVELDFWNSRVDVRELCEALKEQLCDNRLLSVASSGDNSNDDNSDAASDISNTPSTLSVSSNQDPINYRGPKEPFPLRGYQFMLRCNGCTKVANFTGKMHLKDNTRHECRESMMLIHNSDSQLWILIRPRICKDLAEYQLCNMIQSNCPKGYACTFAHCEEEKTLWGYEKKGHFDLLQYWANERSHRSSVEEYVKKMELPCARNVAFLTICRSCYVQSDFQKINCLNPKTKEPCNDSHAWTSILLILEEVTYSEDKFVTEPILLRVHKEIYPHSSAKLRCCYVRDMPDDRNISRLTFCSNSKTCSDGIYCVKAHSDRELQMWHLEKKMRSRFFNEEEVNKWKNYLPFLSPNKVRKLELALSEKPGFGDLPTPTNSIKTGNNPTVKHGKQVSNMNSRPSVPQSSAASNLTTGMAPSPLFSQPPPGQTPLTIRFSASQLNYPPPQTMAQYMPSNSPGFQTPPPMTFPAPLMQPSQQQFGMANMQPSQQQFGMANMQPSQQQFGMANMQPSQQQFGMANMLPSQQQFIRPNMQPPQQPFPRPNMQPPQQQFAMPNKQTQHLQPAKQNKPPISRKPKPGLFHHPQPSQVQKSGPKEKSMVVQAQTSHLDRFNKNLSLYCTCCGVIEASLADWNDHAQSTEHKIKFIISRTAQWIYRAPGFEKEPVGLCSSDDHFCTSLRGYCRLPLNESEKFEWKERIQVTNVVNSITDRSLWDMVCQWVNKLLTNGQSALLFAAIPENMEIIESVFDYCKVADQTPYKCEWNITFISSKPPSSNWLATFILPGYYPYFYFSSGNHRNIQLVHNTYPDNHGHLNLTIGFASEKPGYYEQWLLLSSGSVQILRRFIVHLEAPLALVDDEDAAEKVREGMPNVRKIHKRVQETFQKWKNVKKYDGKDKSLQIDSLYYPLSEPNMMTFLSDVFLFGSPTNTSSLLSHMHQLLKLEENYRLKLLIHLCDGMRLEFRKTGVEIVKSIQTGYELLCPIEEGALFMRLKLPDGCDLFQEHRDPRVNLLRTAIQMVWIKCIPCDGDSQREPLEFECPFVSRNSSVLPTDTSMNNPFHIIIVLNRNVVEKLKLKVESDKKDYFGVVDIFTCMGYDKKNRSPFEALHMAVAKQPYLSNGRPIIHPESRLAHNLPFQPRFTKEQIDMKEDKLNPNQKIVLEELLTKDYSKSFAVEMAPPPFVLRGCFGSGKTKTLGAFIRLCLKLDSRIRILVCTRSNSAADMYITRELDGYETSPTKEKYDKRILRLYSQQRQVHQGGVINNYALLQENGVNYVCPKLSHLKKKTYRVIIMTLNALGELLENDDPDGTRRRETAFDYILVDEAAQILEAEAMIAVTLAKASTRLVFAGDDMQQRPIIFSPRARQAGLSLTVLDRLWAQYEKEGCPVRAHLNVVYRSHPLLVRFLGDAFYSECGKLECNVQAMFNNQPPPEVPGVVMCHVYVGGGESICRSGTSGGLWNIGEAKGVVYRVRHCLRVCNQYRTDGQTAYDEEDVCVISPFYAQITLIRQELRKCGLSRVRVEHLNNVQGREFRVVILSPVLTRKQLNKNDSLEEILDPNKDWQGMDFCHETTLLNAAMSRAISILEVVGDAVGLSLCGSEACNNVWTEFVHYTERYSATSNTCPSHLCTLKWDKNIDAITNPERWSRDKVEIMGVENYYVSQWEAERQKVKSL